MDGELDAGALVGLLADDDRRAVFAALTLGATGLDDAVRASGLTLDRAARALGRLVDAGLVVEGSDGGLAVLGAAFQRAARAARSRPPRDEHAAEPPERRKVLDAFVREGRIVSMPSAHGKRLVVLDWVVQDFEPGRRYPERSVNALLERRFDDVAALRRYLVDEGLLDRAGGEYWRSGGTVESLMRWAVTLYDTLRVAPDASAADIRDAYRREARLHHPDRSEGDAAAMAAINDAYHVLIDPARRAVYDAELRGPRTTSHRPTEAPAAATVVRPVDTTPARYPWKLMLVMAGVGAAVVLVGAALYEPAAEPPPDNLLEPGSCVVIEDNGDAREITCDGTEQYVVEVLVPIGEVCPEGIAGARDRQGRGLACVVPVG